MFTKKYINYGQNTVQNN